MATAASDPVPSASRRDRVRAGTIEEIKTTARRLMADNGTTDVRFSDIARLMGMTAPALYRYFRDRDELLTALLSDGYNDLADQLAEGGAQAERDDVLGRFVGIARAYRSWAHRDRARYALVFGMPIPGYAAPQDGDTTMAAKRAMSALDSVVTDAGALGVLGTPPVDHVGADLVACLSEPAGIPVGTHQAMLHTWAAMHGFVSLEIFGHLDMLPPAALEQLYDAQIRLGAIALGLVAP